MSLTAKSLLLLCLTTACKSVDPLRVDASTSQATPAVVVPLSAPQEARFYPVLHPTETITDRFEHHETWVGQNLQFSPFNKLRLALERHLGRQLQNRGEAHITIVTPPEWEILKGCFSMEGLEAILDTQAIQTAPYEVECVGRGSLGALTLKRHTYFVVVSSPVLLALRKKLEAAAVRAGCVRFKAEPYRPHVTLGFDQRDLHESDGVIKDASSCVYPIQQ